MSNVIANIIKNTPAEKICHIPTGTEYVLFPDGSMASIDAIKPKGCALTVGNFVKECSSEPPK